MSEDGTTTIFDEEIACPKCSARLRIVGLKTRTTPKPPAAEFEVSVAVEQLLLPTKETHKAESVDAAKK